MKIHFTAEFPLLLHHSFCMELSQLSPSMLLSEKTQEGFSYAVNKKKKEKKKTKNLIFVQLKLHWCIRNSLVPQISETFKMEKALYFSPFCLQPWNRVRNKPPYWWLIYHERFLCHLRE